MSDATTPVSNPAAMQGGDARGQPAVQIEKVYVKDLSLEIPHAPQIFAEQLQPQLELQIQTSALEWKQRSWTALRVDHNLGSSAGQGGPAPTDQHFEVTVTATVTAKAGERTLFLVEVCQAGIFLLANIPDQDVEPVLAISCPTILYPYLREAVSDTVMRAGFPAVLLQHMTFDQMYVQRLQERQQQAGAAPRELTR